MKVYVIIPKIVQTVDGSTQIPMSCGWMAAQAVHAAGQLINMLDTDVVTNDVCILSVPDTTELVRVMERLHEQNLFYVSFWDDHQIHKEVLTAVACELEDTEILKDLLPWRCPMTNESMDPAPPTFGA